MLLRYIQPYCYENKIDKIDLRNYVPCYLNGGAEIYVEEPLLWICFEKLQVKMGKMGNLNLHIVSIMVSFK